MKDRLNIKINDYVTYANLAKKHFAERSYSDAAHNCRKAAEVACKIIFYHAYPPVRAENKIQGKSLGELLEQLRKDQLGTKEARSNIETLQLTGNRASHDNVITRQEAELSLLTLDLLTHYLFKENLKIAIPSSFNTNDGNEKTETEKPIEQKVIEKIVIQEKIIEQKLDKETEEALLEKVRHLSRNEREKYEALLNQKQHEQNKISLQREQERLAKEKEERDRKKKLLFVGLPIGLIVIIGVIFVFRAYSPNEPKQEFVELPFVKHPDTTYVAINALDILQDNPQMDFKIENYLNSYIKNHYCPTKI